MKASEDNMLKVLASCSGNVSLLLQRCSIRPRKSSCSVFCTVLNIITRYLPQLESEGWMCCSRLSEIFCILPLSSVISLWNSHVSGHLSQIPSIWWELVLSCQYFQPRMTIACALEHGKPSPLFPAHPNLNCSSAPAAHRYFPSLIQQTCSHRCWVLRLLQSP